MSKLIRGMVMAACLLSPFASQAGGATLWVNACVYLPTAPVKPIDFDFTPKRLSQTNGSSDMSVPKPGTLTVNAPGVTCMTLDGGIQGATEKDSYLARWEVSYQVKGQAYSGSADFDVNLTNNTPPPLNSNVNLVSYTNAAELCSSGALCNTTNRDLNNGDSVFLIFKPMAASPLSTLMK